MARIRLRVYLGEEHALGPGKVELLEQVQALGSISAAARSMGMAYRHAWELVDALNRCFRRPVVTAATGGRAGGGARLTPFGEEVVRRFRAMEDSANAAVAADLAALEAAAGGARRGRARRGVRARRRGAGRA